MSPPAQIFYDDPSRQVAIAGGFRSGKSVAACAWQIMLGRAIPNSTHLVARLNMPALRNTTMKTFLSLFPMEWLAKNGWKESEGKLITNNGAEYLFRHLDITDAAVEGWVRSLNLTSFLVDQAEEVSEGVYMTLVGRLSQPTSPRHFGRLALNPAGQDWIWRRFYDPTRSEGWKKHHGHTVSIYDNSTNLPPELIEDMENTYPEDWKARFMRGEFSDFSDLVYKDWDSRLHVYDSTKSWPVFDGANVPPADWPTYVGVDIGGVDPWAFVFIACQPGTGFLYQFDEIYASGILIQELSERYWAIMGSRELHGLAYDYENQQAALEMQEYVISGVPAIKAVRPGIFKTGQYLHPDPRLQHPFLGRSPSPRYFVAANCENTIREMSAWKWGKDRQGRLTGEPAEGNDHTCDALRYAIHTFRPEPQELPAPEVWENPGLDALSRMFWRDVKREEEILARKPRRYFRYGPLHI